jgi:hypothetical protein
MLGQPPATVADFLIRSNDFQELTVDDLTTLLQGDETPGDVDLEDVDLESFVLGVLEKLQALGADPGLSKNFLAAVLQAAPSRSRELVRGLMCRGGPRAGGRDVTHTQLPGSEQLACLGLDMTAKQPDRRKEEAALVPDWTFDDLPTTGPSFSSLPIETEYGFFGPSHSSYLSFPLPQSSAKFISTSAQVNTIEWTSQAYGLDCEWRPNVRKYQKNPVSVLTIASEEVQLKQEVLVIDMLALNHCKSLDSKLQALLMDPSITKVGMGFHEDLKLLRHSCPYFQAFETMSAYADLLADYKAVFNSQSPGGLTGMCRTLLGKPLCKQEQCSDWNRRPLELDQLHYAVMDAYVQVILWKELLRLEAVA